MRGCLWYWLADGSLVAAHPDRPPDEGIALGAGLLDDEGVRLAHEVMRSQLDPRD